MNQTVRRRPMAAAILSLSLLTVMAGAAVAPALGVIRDYFAAESPMLVQMIISMPALFIFITNLIFPALCRRFRTKTLVMAGLLLYTLGGIAAGLFSNIYLLLIMRALVGIGVGIIMPMSTGLLTYYFANDGLDRMMGLSSAMNQMGGVVATLLAGILAAINWRAAFLVYLLGLISIVLIALFLPDDRLDSGDGAQISGRSLAEYAPYIIGMFFVMMSFFIYPSNCAMETAKEGIIPQNAVAAVMAFADLVAFGGGLLFAKLNRTLRNSTRLVAPLAFLLGYFFLLVPGGWTGGISGAACIGFANGVGIPYLIASASKKAGRAAVTTAIPLLSAALYIAQFSTPILLNLLERIPGIAGSGHPSYLIGIGVSLVLIAWSAVMLKEPAAVTKSRHARSETAAHATVN
ncbi:MAG: MFS transporter [Firmicutes bacterium]|nr:MFS transporter [Bacillota bacterium]